MGLFVFFLSYFILFAGFRREVLKAMNSNYADELRYSKEMIEEHPKNYQVMNVNMYLIIKQKMSGTFDFLFFAMGANSKRGKFLWSLQIRNIEKWIGNFFNTLVDRYPKPSMCVEILKLS